LIERLRCFLEGVSFVLLIAVIVLAGTEDAALMSAGQFKKAKFCITHQQRKAMLKFACTQSYRSLRNLLSAAQDIAQSAP
jgi:hypothetical protein